MNDAAPPHFGWRTEGLFGALGLALYVAIFECVLHADGRLCLGDGHDALLLRLLAMIDDWCQACLAWAKFGR